MTGGALWRSFAAGALNGNLTEEQLKELLSDLDVKLFQLPKATRLQVVKRLAAKPARQFPFLIAQEAGRLFHRESSLWEEAILMLSGALPHLPRGERAMFFYFLFEAVEEGDNRTRMAAFGAVMKMGTEAEEFVPMIKGILENGAKEDRKAALRVLIAHAGANPRAEDIIRLVSTKDPDPEVRKLASRALMGIGDR